LEVECFEKQQEVNPGEESLLAILDLVTGGVVPEENEPESWGQASVSLP